MKVETKYFGIIECNEEDLIIFEDGFIGMEDYKKWLPVSFGDTVSNMSCLQSVDEVNLAFVTINPFVIVSDYNAEISDADKDALEIDDENTVTCHVICTMKETVEDSTINLKAPVVINTKNRKGKQVVLDYPYEFRYKLSNNKEKGC